jgi:hypothetical protein
MKNVLIAVLNSFKAPILAILEREAIKILIANAIRSVWMLDFRLWMIDFSIQYLGDHVVRPMIDAFFRAVNYKIEVKDGEYVLKKINSASNVDDWNNAADNV